MLATGSSPMSVALVRSIDACLLSLLFIAPLLMGGRHPVGEYVWLLIAFALGVATLLCYRPTKPSAGDYLWLAAAALVVFQLIPVPASLLSGLNPGLAELLPGMADSAAIPFAEPIYGDRPISVNPYRTRLALGMLLAYGVIFHTVTRRVQSSADVRRLLSWIAAASVAIAILALAQRFAGNGKFLWVYDHVSRSASDVVKGPFQNQNHFAQLMALGLGPLLYFATSRSGKRRTLLAMGGATICLLAGLLTFSRGGAIAIAAAGLVACLGLAFAGLVDRKRTMQLMVPGLLTVVLLGIWGGERLLSRVETLTGDPDLSSMTAGRLELWQSHLRAIAASPWVGYGAASHEDIYPAFIEKDFGVKFTHGESGYLPIQLENGIPGTLLLLVALGLAAAWSLRNLRRPPSENHERESRRRRRRGNEEIGLAVACIAGVIASAVQSIADFVWYIPACITPTLMLLACLYRLAASARAATPALSAEARSAMEPPPSPPESMTSIPWLAIPVAALTVSIIWGTGSAWAEPLWHRFTAMGEEPLADAVVDVPPAVALSERISLLERIVRRNPEDPAGHFRLGASLLSVLELPGQRSDAVDDRLLAAAAQHVTLGLQSAPLHADGYILLADVARFANQAPENQLALLQQAVRVSPTDIDVSFKAGLAAFKGGHVAWGLETWKSVMESPTGKRDKLLIKLADLLPPDLLLASFSFDHTALSILYNHHLRAHPGGGEGSKRLAQTLVASLVEAAAAEEDPVIAGGYYHRAGFILEQIGGPPEKVLDLASRAVAASTADFSYRIRLTNLLIQNQRLTDAKKHLRWCQIRKPQDPQTTQQETLFTEAFRLR